MRKTTDLKSLFEVLKNNIIVILIVSLIGLILGVGYAKIILTPMYVSTQKIYVNNKVGDVDITSHNDIISSQDLISSYLVFMNDNEVFGKVSEAMEGKYSASQLKGMTSFSQVNESTFIKVTVECSSPEDAQKICSFVSSYSKLVIEEVTRIQNIEIYGTPSVPTSPSSPNTPMYALLGFVLGFLITYVVYYVIYAKDNRIKGKSTILDCFPDVSFFGEVPSFNLKTKVSKAYEVTGKRE